MGYLFEIQQGATNSDEKEKKFDQDLEQWT
jgi:hypothetical protein